MRLSQKLALILLCSFALSAQTVPGAGWSSFGVLPFRGYDFVIVKAPTQYVLYYSRHPTDKIGEGLPVTQGRAFSTDLKTWKEDTGDICATSGDLCHFTHNRAGALSLPDGRTRMFVNSGGQLSSLISSDGIIWTIEPGVRFLNDTTSIYERAVSNFALQLVSFVNLSDGSTRMYYPGAIAAGTPGTPSYYNSNCGGCGTVLSAISRDNGLTWTREPGARVNPLVQGPVNILPLLGAGTQQQWYCDDVSAVSVQEGLQTVFRLYCPTGPDGTVSYVSNDGLSFSLESQIPADRGDAKAIVLPDGRTWLVTNQYPDAIDDTIVYGPQSLILNNIRADIGAEPMSGFGLPFQSSLMGLTGNTSGPIALEAVTEVGACANPDDCTFHKEDFAFSPATHGPATFSVDYVGRTQTPPSYSVGSVVVHAQTPEVTAVGAIFCMNQVLGRSDTSVFCKKSLPALPMNKMTFVFSTGTKAYSQPSDILSLGGQGYPYTATSSASWATVSPASGTAPQKLTVTVDPAGLAPGTYSGTVTIAAEGTTETIALTTVVSTGPVIAAVKNAASAADPIAPNTFVTIFGSGFASDPVIWSPTAALPTSLGSVSVKLGGKDAFISYASPGQLNVLAPADIAAGNITVQVTSPGGTASANAVIGPVAPSWFVYPVGTSTWIAALIANETTATTITYAAPTGKVPGALSRAPRAGDILQLYANGLGATNPAPPAGQVLTTAYALDDLTRVKLTIGGKPAVVQYAGLVGAGLYQLNVLVPAGIGSGELQVVMYVDGQPTQDGVTLSFQ